MFCLLWKVSKSILEHIAEINNRKDIGVSLADATDLMKEFESFKEDTKVFAKFSLQFHLIFGGEVFINI